MDKAFVVRDEDGILRGRISDRFAATKFARQLVYEQRLYEARVYFILPDGSERLLSSYGRDGAPAKPLFLRGTPRRRRPSELAERVMMIG